MANAKVLLIIGLAGVAILASTAQGGAPMGPPVALLGEGQWSVGGEYGRETITMKADGSLRPVYSGVGYDFDETVTINDLAMNMFFVTFGYGITDNWDIFARVGAADAKDDMSGRGLIPNDPEDPGDFLDVHRRTYDLGGLDNDMGLAWGVGTRATFARSGPWAFGGLVQATWFRPGDSDFCYEDPLWPGMDVYHIGKASLDFWEAQVGLAVSYQADTVRFWGGPFLQFIMGDFDRDGRIVVAGVDTGGFKASGDLQEESQFGGQGGIGVGLSKQVDVWVEGQVTSDSWFVGVGLTFKPQETFGM